MAQTRTWKVQAQQDPETGELYLDDQELAHAALEVNAILKRVGGTVTIGAMRSEIDGEWHTLGFAYLWQAFAPGARRAPAPEPEAAEEFAELEPEPVG